MRLCNLTAPAGAGDGGFGGGGGPGGPGGDGGLGGDGGGLGPGGLLAPDVTPARGRFSAGGFAEKKQVKYRTGFAPTACGISWNDHVVQSDPSVPAHDAQQAAASVLLLRWQP
jgi:hypothetical protein